MVKWYRLNKREDGGFAGGEVARKTPTSPHLLGGYVKCFWNQGQTILFSKMSLPVS
jgi:hypothetical protein